jgi:hypothetical protein
MRSIANITEAVMGKSKVEVSIVRALRRRQARFQAYEEGLCGYWMLATASLICRGFDAQCRIRRQVSIWKLAVRRFPPQDFARTCDVLAEGSLMIKGALSTVAGFISLCLPLFAQQTDYPDVFSALNDNSFPRLPSLTLSDGGLFSFSGAVASPLLFNWMETTPADFLPALSMASTTARSQRATAPAATANDSDSSKEVVDVRRPNLLDHVSGEMGFLYGRSTGKFGGEVEQGYIIGGVGDDKFNITVGAAYEHSSGRFSRFGR